MSGNLSRVGVIGGGAWGTALAQAAIRAGRQTTLWVREAAVAETIERDRINSDYLPDVALDPSLRATTNLAEVAAADVLLLVTPAQHLRSVCTRLAPHLQPGSPAVICSKGIELNSHALLTDAAAASLPRGTPLAVLSGPTFATEVARGQPTAVTLACADERLGAALVEALGSRTFRPYQTNDVVGAQIGGAVKNVLAIACGVVVGRKLGDNARAALVTRGLAEIARLGLALGARAETLMGLSGLGDLTLTCSSFQSRNMSLGVAVGSGRALDDVLKERRSVAEGVYTARAVVELAATLNVSMPICAAVDAILNKDADLDETIHALLVRPFRGETE